MHFVSDCGCGLRMVSIAVRSFCQFVGPMGCLVSFKYHGISPVHWQDMMKSMLAHVLDLDVNRNCSKMTLGILACFGP